MNFLQRITPETARGVNNSLQKFNVGEYTDCPVFDGLIDFCKLYTGCSIGTHRRETDGGYLSEHRRGSDSHGCCCRCVVCVQTVPRS